MIEPFAGRLFEQGRTPQQQEVFEWTSGLLHLRAEHKAITEGMEENLFADADSFAFTRTLSHQGCKQAPGDRLLIVLNKSKQSKMIDLPLSDNSLEGCSEFTAMPQAAAATATQNDGKLHINEPAESLSVFQVR